MKYTNNIRMEGTLCMIYAKVDHTTAAISKEHPWIYDEVNLTA